MERCWRIFCDYPILGMGARNLVSPEVASKYGFVGANFFQLGCRRDRGGDYYLLASDILVPFRQV